MPTAFLRSTKAWQRLRDYRMLWDRRAERAFLRRFVPPHTLAFDIGANVGHKSLQLLALGARVVAVEPQAELAARLRRRLGRYRRFHVIHTALGSASGTAVLMKSSDLSEIATLRPAGETISRFLTEHPFDTEESVPVTTLDALVQEFGVPAFCKIDVEGYEFTVLQGLSRPLGVLSFEFTREILRETAKCLGHLQSLGYKEFNLCLGETPSWALPAWSNGEAVQSFLNLQTDPLLWGDIYARV